MCSRILRVWRNGIKHWYYSDERCIMHFDHGGTRERCVDNGRVRREHDSLGSLALKPKSEITYQIFWAKSWPHQKSRAKPPKAWFLMYFAILNTMWGSKISKKCCGCCYKTCRVWLSGSVGFLSSLHLWWTHEDGYLAHHNVFQPDVESSFLSSECLFLVQGLLYVIA